VTTRPLEVIDFTGGVTDYFIDGRANQYQMADNLFIDPNRKLVTRNGSELFLNSPLPTGIQRIHTMFFLEDTLIVMSGNRAFYELGGVWTEILGPDGVGAVFPSGDENIKVSHTEWRDHVLLTHDQFSGVMKMYKNESGNIQIRNAGLPTFPEGASFNPNGSGHDTDFLYQFVFSYTYRVGDSTFLDRGETFIFPEPVNAGLEDANTAGVIINLPTELADNANFDVTQFNVEIYRTIGNGQDFFLVDTVPFGTPTYVDQVIDSELVNNEPIYTAGGAADNDPAPTSKFVHVVNDIGYYANVREGTEDDRYVVRQSVPGDVDSVPRSFFAHTEQEIRGLSSIYDRPLVFCDRYIYRIDNQIDSFGGGNMDLRRIDDRAGCVSNSSIVRTHKGVFWAGEIGFYWSDGFKVTKISDNYNETYKQFVSTAGKACNIYGAYDPSNERVYWSVNDEDSDEPNMCIILDLKWGISEQSVFTTMSGGDNFNPSSIVFDDNVDVFYRSDINGYVFNHRRGLLSDPKIDNNRLPEDWATAAIIYDYRSTFYDFGTKFVRKFVPRILVSASNDSNVSIQINSSNDNDRVVGSLVPIRRTNNIIWGDTVPVWGAPEPRWDFKGIVEEWRRFPAGGLRCQYKQIQITNAVVEIISSETLGNVDVDTIQKTATLITAPQFLPDMEDFFISFASDGFQRRFLITSQTLNTVVYEDSSNLGPSSGELAFKIFGIPKNEVILLNGYVIHYMMLSKSHQPFSTSGGYS